MRCFSIAGPRLPHLHCMRESGRYVALHFSCEEGRALHEVSQVERALPDELQPPPVQEAPAGAFLRV